MLSAATFINPLLKIVTTVAILAAVYLLIVRPILDTTENAIERGTRATQEAQAQARERAEQIQLDIAMSRIQSAITSLQSAGWPEAVKAVRACRAEARNSPRAADRCVAFAQRITTAVRSNRTFALSYANSLDGHGRGADADRVRDCVDGAGFKPAAMQRCRDLADKLLFNR